MSVLTVSLIFLLNSAVFDAARLCIAVLIILLNQVFAQVSVSPWQECSLLEAPHAQQRANDNLLLPVMVAVGARGAQLLAAAHSRIRSSVHSIICVNGTLLMFVFSQASSRGDGNNSDINSLSSDMLDIILHEDSCSATSGSMGSGSNGCGTSASGTSNSGTSKSRESASGTSGSATGLGAFTF